MHGGFCGEKLLFPRQSPDIVGKLLQLFRILLQLSAVVGKLHKSTLQFGNVGGGKLYIALPVPIGNLSLFESPHGFIRKPICILHIRHTDNAIRRIRQRLLDLSEILHIAVKQISAQLIHLPIAENYASRAVKKARRGGKQVKALLDRIEAQPFRFTHRHNLLSACGRATDRPPA